jgi:hypothetical protein
MTRDIGAYASAYLADYGFEQVLVGFRQRVIMQRLRRHRPAVVLEIGCGADLLYAGYLAEAQPVECWMIVEPSDRWAAQARAAKLPGLVVVEGFMEESIDKVRRLLPRPPDLVISSSVLQEVPSAGMLLSAIREVMDCNSLLHVNVPNARSLHRRLALAMGLIPALTTLSDRNRLLQQYRVFDFESLEQELAHVGLRVVDRGGCLVKPFTHAQMESVAPILGEAVIEGLHQLAIAEPEMACEIFAEARKT